MAGLAGDGKVALPGYQLFDSLPGVGDPDVYLYVGVFLPEFGKQPGEDEVAGYGAGAYLYYSGNVIGNIGEVPFYVGKLSNGLPGKFIEYFTFNGKVGALLAPGEDLYAQFPLQLGDVLAYGGLGDADGCRCR
jgi:hypothetical protein